MLAVKFEEKKKKHILLASSLAFICPCLSPFAETWAYRRTFIGLYSKTKVHLQWN